MGNTLTDLLKDFKNKIESISVSDIVSIPNSDKIIDNVKNFFGGDVLTMSKDEIESKIENELRTESIKEGFWSDFFKKDWSSDNETMDTPISKVKGGLVQKIGALLEKIFQVNVLSFGLIGSVLTNFLLNLNVSPSISLISSMVGFLVVYIIRKLIRFTKERK